MSPLTSLLPLLLAATLHAQPPIITDLDFGSCPPITMEDLGNTETLSESGLLAGALEEIEVGTSAVRVRSFHIVCESSGLLRNTTRSVSLLVNFDCMGLTCRRGGNQNEVVNLTEQFQFNCTASFFEGGGGAAFHYESGLFSGTFRRVDPVAGFDTAREERCGMCLDPAVDVGLPADNESHCIGEQKYVF